MISKGSTLDFGLCDHEESDTRMMVHLAHAVRNGCKKVMLSTVDSNGVVISIHVFSVLRGECQTYSLGDSGNNQKSISIIMLVKYSRIWEKINADHFFVAST